MTDGTQEHGFTEQVDRRPEEGHALEEAEEQRRVAEGRQGAADVGDQEDEENDGMHAVLAVLVARSRGRMSSMAAPVVPIQLARMVPSASRPVFTRRT